MSLPADTLVSDVNGLRRVFDELLNEARNTSAQLAECHTLLFRIAYGSNKPGDRPLAGGLTLDARKLLARHDIVIASEEWGIPGKDEDIPEEATPKVADHTHRGPGC